MVKKKLNIKKLGIFVGIILLIIILAIIGIKKLVDESKLKKTVEYKLEHVGYSTNEIKVIKDTLDSDKINNLINTKYKSNLTKFINQKYFIYNNLDRYLDYYSKNSKTDPKKVIGIVNTNADTDWYSKINDTDISKNEKMLVNKFYKLGSDYEPSDLVLVSSSYAYSGKYVSESMYDDLINMLSDAKDAGYTLVVNQGYRSYADQEEAYNDIEDSSGEDTADRLAARAGHSEYQTGLSVVIKPYNVEVEEGKTYPENEWLLKNCYRYGFILRYPENTSDITGFETDMWRFRYVGLDIARKIHEENITFDEYYAFYLNK